MDALPFKPGPLNEYLDAIESESRQVTKEKEKEWEDNLNYYRGQHWQQKLPSHRIPFTANYVNVTVKRLVALMTDTKPNIDVKARIPGLTKMTQEVLVPALRSNWDEQGYEQKFAGAVLPKSIVFGACAVHVGFNPQSGSMGDISLDVIDPRSLILDPAVRQTTDLDSAEYSGYQLVLSLQRIRQLFPEGKVAQLVQPESSLSPFLTKVGAGGGSGVFASPAHPSLHRFSRAGDGIDSTAVPRARVQVIVANDRRTVGELPKDMQEQFMQKGLTKDDLAWPGGRRIVRAGANKVILWDGPNPFIDRKNPLVMFDWGLETEHPWGSSEVKLIKSLQAILNKLGSAIVENAVKMNNNIWIGDRDALEKHEWDRLTDAPGLLVKLRPQRTLRRESAPALPGSVFQMLQWLVNVMDTLTGLVDVTQGRRPIGIVSSHAIEALNLSAQTLIRLQTRKFESFLERIGQRLIARIFQFYTSDRLMHYLSPGGNMQEFRFFRDDLVNHKGKFPDSFGKLIERDFDYHKDLDLIKFIVTPGSSMAISRLQKGQMATGLYNLRLIPGIQVLQALEWEDPEGTINEARAEAAAGVQQQGPTKRARIAA